MVKLLLAIAIATVATQARSAEPYLQKSAEVIAHPDQIIAPEDVAKWKARGSEISPQDAQAIEKIAADAHTMEKAASDQNVAAQQPFLAPVAPSEPQPVFRLFVSLGMPPGALAGAVDIARRDRRIALVFRGVPAGGKVNDLLAGLKEALGTTDGAHPAPDLQIDPPRFRKDHITVVPTLVRYEKGEAVAHVAGLFNPDWMDREAAAGRRGDLGQQGPTYAITEEDMEERMKTLASGINYTVMRTAAMANAWKKVPIIDLPAATKTRERELDPTIVVSQTIIAPDGRVIARAGERVNPLERAPFRTRMVIFDATKPEQVAFAQAAGKDAPDGDVMYLFTRLAETPSWQALSALSETFGHPVYRLTDAIKQRFDVGVVPTVIEAKGNIFQIHERPAVALPMTQKKGLPHVDSDPSVR